MTELTVHTKRIAHLCIVFCRPLPRGLIKYSEVVTVIQLVLGSMTMYACVMAWKFSLATGITFGVQV